MQAIEFDSVVQNASIPLPDPTFLASGMAVRVVVMFEGMPAANSDSSVRDAISELCASPLFVPDFMPFSRVAAHER